MCNKWLTFRTKKLNFWIKQKLINVINFFFKEQQHQKKHVSLAIKFEI